MQSVRDNDQQSYFYVVWPDDRAVQTSSSAVATVVNTVSANTEEQQPPERTGCETIDHEESVQQPTPATAINNAISLVASGGAHERGVTSRPAPGDGDAQCANSANESSDLEEESASGLSGASDSDEAGGSPCVNHTTAPPIVRPLFLRHRRDNGTSKSSKNGDIGEQRR